MDVPYINFLLEVNVGTLNLIFDAFLGKHMFKKLNFDIIRVVKAKTDMFEFKL